MKQVVWTTDIQKLLKSFPHMTRLSDHNLTNLDISIGAPIQEHADEWLENCEGSISVQCAVNNFCVAFEKESDAILFKLTLD